MKALIFDKKVIEVAKNTFPVCPEMEWLDCDDSIKIGYSWNGNKFKSSDRSEDKQLKEVKAAKLSICRNYLASNDWMAARKVKRNIEIPQDIIDKEILCVKAIDKLKASTTLKKVVDCDVSDYVISN